MTLGHIDETNDERRVGSASLGVSLAQSAKSGIDAAKDMPKVPEPTFKRYGFTEFRP